MEDRWLSVEEIASYLGIKRDTVYRWINEKQMPAHRMGRLWKFRKEEVDDWVKIRRSCRNQILKIRLRGKSDGCSADIHRIS